MDVPSQLQQLALDSSAAAHGAKTGPSHAALALGATSADTDRSHDGEQGSEPCDRSLHRHDAATHSADWQCNQIPVAAISIVGWDESPVSV